MEPLTLEKLAERSKIHVTTLQNGISAGLVPQQSWLVMERQEHGYEINIPLAVYLACAARMQQAGFSDPAIHALLARVFQIPGPNETDSPMPRALHWITEEEDAVVQIADGSYVRWKTGNEYGDWGYVCSHAVLPADPEYAPSVLTAIDLGRIREQVRGVRLEKSLE